jgi:tRNA1Val (adenine37-N6)-methyltransferase
MLAQRSSGSANITAIEMDPNAFDLAKLNVTKNSFSELIQVSNSKLQDFKSNVQFDLIVCNPPYFINSLKPPTEYRIKQRHSKELTFDDILTSIASLLSPSGRFGLVLPVEEGELFIKLAKNFGFGLIRQCDVFAKQGKNQERYLLEFSYKALHTQRTHLTIVNNDGDWTDEYKLLTRDFYLNF